MDRATQAGMSPGDAARADAESRSHRLAASTPGFTEERRVEWLQWTLQEIDAKEKAAEAEAAEAEAARQTDEWLRLQLADAKEIGDAVARNAEEMVRQAEALEAAARTPEQAAREQIARLDELYAGGGPDALISAEAYRYGTRKALEDAASMIPDTIQTTIGAQGSFSAFEAAAANTSGLSDRIASATEETAKNTAKIAELCTKLGVNYD